MGLVAARTATFRGRMSSMDERIREATQRAAAHAKIKLLHARYVLGYLAAGFGVSAPVTLGYQVYYGQDARQMLALTGLSLMYGAVFGLPFLVLEPLTRIEWERMRVPEFRLFELAVCRHATLASFALFLASLFGLTERGARFAVWIPSGLFWTVFVLMFTAWAKIKVQVLIFPEFYADRGGERLLQVPKRVVVVPPVNAPEAQPEPAAPLPAPPPAIPAPPLPEPAPAPPLEKTPPS
jgi:hypothetical protein